MCVFALRYRAPASTLACLKCLFADKRKYHELFLVRKPCAVKPDHYGILVSLRSAANVKKQCFKVSSTILLLFRSEEMLPTFCRTQLSSVKFMVSSIDQNIQATFTLYAFRVSVTVRGNTREIVPRCCQDVLITAQCVTAIP